LEKAAVESSTPESHIAVIQILNVIGSNVPEADADRFFISSDLRLWIQPIEGAGRK
jgi:hypothetical protein